MYKDHKKPFEIYMLIIFAGMSHTLIYTKLGMVEFQSVTQNYSYHGDNYEPSQVIEMINYT